MPNTCFDGDFRQKPQQNFSGVNRNLHRDQLLQNAANERRQREETRKHTQFAIRFQAQIRRYLAQQRLYEQLRADFDHHVSNLEQDRNIELDSIEYITKRLMLFYSQSNKIDRTIRIIYQNFLILPLSINNTGKYDKVFIVRNFFLQFLMGPLSEHFKVKLLPSLCLSMPTPRNLMIDKIVDAFESIKDSDESKITSYSYLWIVYSALKLISSQLMNANITMSNDQMKKFFIIIRIFFENLSTYVKTRTNFNFNYSNITTNGSGHAMEIDGEDEDDDDDELLILMNHKDAKEIENEKIFKVLITDMFTIINDSVLCSMIVRYMDNIVEKDKESLMSVSYLCHSMLLFHPFAVHKNRLLHSLAFNSNFLRDLWKFITTESTISLFDSTKTYLNILSSGVQTSSVDWQQFVPPLTLFCSLFNYFLQTLDDVEFFNEVRNQIEIINSNQLSYNYSVLPFKLIELVDMSSNLRDICISLIEFAYQDRKVINLKSQMFREAPANVSFKDDYSIQCWSMLLKSSLKLLRHIYARDIRQQFCPDAHWICPSKSFAQILPANFNQAIQHRGHLYQEFRGLRHLGRDEMVYYGSPIPVKDIVNVTIIQELPFVVSFQERVKIMQSLISFEKRSNERAFYDTLTHGNPTSIRRNYIYEDSFDKLSIEKIPDLKKVIRIQLISSLGLEETGIDGGGVFREFLSETLKTAFDPNRGFFKLTNDGLLYPNPSIHLLVENYEQHYYFIGRLLGKAIYENMLAELPIAPFFLAKLLSNNSDVEINHLASLDPVLYRNLISLKNYKGDVSDLGLDFSVITCELGTNILEELKPNGTNIAVTNINRIEYIHLMSDYKLNKQIRNQCTAFKQGFYNVVNLDWIKMFDTKELQILLSGAQTPIDLDDLKKHTVYSGGYTYDHPVIQTFWEVVSQFEEVEKRKLLKFITSCSRPPLLGFKDLYPALCIQNAGKEPDRLPTSSTCMNLLKLPEVYDKSLMKQKISYSINSASGFELS
ncbi:hypothetical protein RDWZM_003907 [Blomia tropicalis]|uniref:Ubiquitin-protein ligase E3C n=1 Tax=Blomia tropicalis TaxID=40697 RepID=A0A9Q0MJ47_BLOTA|nr:hypothetical protein RDWZM_003907 [Blomia tropicalis]